MQLNGQTFRLRGSKSKGEFVLRKLRCFLFRGKVRMFRPIYLSRLICTLGGLPYLLDMHARQSAYTRKEEVCFSIRCPFFVSPRFALKSKRDKARAFINNIFRFQWNLYSNQGRSIYNARNKKRNYKCPRPFWNVFKAIFYGLL